MAFKVAFNEALGIVEVAYQGLIDLDALNASAAIVYGIARERNCRLALIDWSSAVLGLGVTDIYTLPQSFAEIAGSVRLSLYNFRRAVLVEKKNDDFLFLETVALNRGQSVRIFTDRTEALDWLYQLHRVPQTLVGELPT